VAREPKTPKTDDELVESARRKEKAGESTTSREKEAVNRRNKECDTADRERLFASCPKGVYLSWADTSAKIASEHGERHNFPLNDGRTVDVRAVLKRLHEFIRENRYKLAADDDPLMAAGGGDSKNLETYRKWKARLTELEYYRKLGAWISREDVHVGLSELAAILSRAGETLQRQCGPDAREIVADALEEFRAVILARFSNNTNGTSEDDGDDPAPENKPKRSRSKRSRGANS